MILSKFLVISDSHGYTDCMFSLEPLLDQVQGVIHLGDHAEDIEVLQGLRPDFDTSFWHVVRGNCDGKESGPQELLLSVQDTKILITHGHHYDVKLDLLKVLYRGLALEANAILFGHTHIPLTLSDSGVVLHNPGSISLPKGGSKRNYSVMSICGRNVEFEHFQIV